MLYKIRTFHSMLYKIPTSLTLIDDNCGILIDRSIIDNGGVIANGGVFLDGVVIADAGANTDGAFICMSALLHNCQHLVP